MMKPRARGLGVENMSGERGLIPALRYDILTPVYDLAIRLTLPERRFKMRLIESARIATGHKVLDLGCGTGTLLLMAARLAPGATIVGVDADERILERARRKVAAAGLTIRLDRASATDLPYPDKTFDRVLSSLLFHHLTASEKQCAFEAASASWGPAASCIWAISALPPRVWSASRRI